jgi:hypothetical protein
MATVPLPESQSPQLPAPETLVVARVGEGFRVYSIHAPHLFYFVTGSPDAPVCTCPEFRTQEHDPTYRCAHIRAVYGNGPTVAPAFPSIPASPSFPNPMPQEPLSGGDAGAPAQMSIKRSVSPDGRIDALSVEFSCGVEQFSDDEITASAQRFVGLQHAIAEGFRQNGNAQPRPHATPNHVPTDGTHPAQLVGVGGMDGKWGRRLFLLVQVGDRRLRFFGNEKQLADAITVAGFPGYAQHLVEGLAFNLPCRVTTSPSADGRFINIDKILPGVIATNGPGQGR